MDDHIENYVQYLRTKGTPVNTAVVLGIASGIAKNHDSGLLASNGGHIEAMGQTSLILHGLCEEEE